MWRELELNMKNDCVDVFRRCTALTDARVADLGVEIQKQNDERNRIQYKLEEASREQGKRFNAFHRLHCLCCFNFSI